MEIEPSIILFDGHCSLCHGAVGFIVRRDRRGRFRFAPLQSNIGRDLLARAGHTVAGLDTMILLEGGCMYQQSTAALRVARRLDGCWPLLYVLIIIPRPLRDLVYRWIARNRYAWFGRMEHCLLPTPDVRERFLG